MALPFLTRPRANPIPEPLWRAVLAAHPYLLRLGDGRLERLRARSTELLHRMRFAGADGLVVTDEMGVSIATQASLPVLELGLDWYGAHPNVVVYPGPFRARRVHSDDLGVVHEFTEDLSGEMMDGGPIMLSWEDARRPDDSPVGNVVIHEFLHRLDLADGLADGIPPLHQRSRQRWARALEGAFEAFVTLLDAAEAAIPPWVDPESDAAMPYYSMLPLDPYAATDPAEFFAVAGEAYFVDPDRLRAFSPAFHRELSAFFNVD